MYYFLKAIRQYADFSGRARRREFWMFFLFYVIFIVFLQVAIFTFFVGKKEIEQGVLLTIFPCILGILSLLAPFYAVTVRRLHDTGRSASFVLLTFVPIIGDIILIVLCSQDSQPGENEYGPNPKTILV